MSSNGSDQANGQYVLVVHTFMQINEELGRIRLISARSPTSTEIHAYQEE